MDKRTEFVEKLSAQMVEWDVQIEQLRDKAEASSAEEKFDYAQTIDALQLKRDQAAKKLQGIAMASEDEWKDMKDGAEQIWSEVKTFFRETIVKTQ
ncbi:hypothetical protein JCM30471_21890 [Desulfuromonas carbonis]|uniref:hypothetical protein n=1 Tax=Desulfuromonas sp. DDH964 TaxID=1823759 RepID=UPI00078C9EA3|nr:hypothetical protein [Desulfuromonas sp. DDH964]AMV73770.1 hypothetical protein DBW_3472 [Desulfuromonas sp. DDH964]